MLQQIKNSASTEADSVCAVLYCELQDGPYAMIGDEEASRLEQCVRVLQKLSVGEVVSDELLHRALTEDEYSEYQRSFDQSATHTEEEWLQSRPEALEDYIALVKRADFYNAMADRYARAKTKSFDSSGMSSAQRMHRKAEALYQRASEYLQSITDGAQDAAEVERWLDRYVSWGAGEEPSIDVAGIPRVRGSKSKYAQASSRPLWGVKRSKFWRQREAITLAVIPLIYADDAVEVDLIAAHNSKLKQLLSVGLDDEF